MKIIPKKPNIGVRFRTTRYLEGEGCDWTYYITGIKDKYYILTWENSEESGNTQVLIDKALEFFKSGYYYKI